MGFRVADLLALFAAGVQPGDSDDLILKKKVALLFGVLILPCSVLWSTLLALIGETSQSIGPVWFFVTVGAGTIIHVRTKRLQELAISLNVALIVSPGWMTLGAGGALRAYCVFLWSTVTAPMCSIFFWNSAKLGAFTLGIAYAFVVFSYFIEMDEVYSLSKNPPSKGWQTVFLLMNSLIPGGIGFAAVVFFASTAKAQRERLQESIATAKLVTDALVRFDVDEADRMLDGGGGDPQLDETLRGLVANLRQYRAYLPDNLVGGDSDDAGREGSEDSEYPPRFGKAGSAVQISVNELGRKKSGVSRTERASVAASHASSDARTRPAGLEVELRSRNVSLLHMNRRGYARFSRIADKLVRFHAAEVERMLKLLRECKGVLDSWSGDHTLATYNAARDCGTHAVQAMTTALRSTQDPGTMFADDPGDLPAVCMVSSGKALCGNLGSSVSKRYQVIGPVSSLARIGERVATHMGVSVLCDVNASSAAQHRFELRQVEYIFYAKLSSEPFFVWESLNELQGPSHEEEWMYQLQDGKDADAWQEWNEALAQLVKEGKCSLLDDLSPEHRLQYALLSDAKARRAGMPGPVALCDIKLGRSVPECDA